MKIYKLILGIVLVSSLGACKKMDSLLDNPNSVDPSQANVDLLLNESQLSFSGVYNTLSDVGGELTRQQVMFGPLYSNAYAPSTFDGVWTTAYTGVIKNGDKVIDLALAQKKYKHAGMAQVLKAYTLGSLVDFFGDVPNSESNMGVENLNPKADKGADVYKTVFALLDSAISNFGKANSAAGPTNDLFYNGDFDNWTTAAKTIKLKFLMQTRLVDATASAQIDQLLTDGDLISTAAQDFVFKYSTVNNSPDSRHPHYATNYNNSSTGSNSVREYIGTYFMWCLAYEKGNGAITSLDPRRRFYLYRQRTNYAAVDESTCPCAFALTPGHFPSTMPFCLPGPSGGYWGRDHGDDDGIPPDNSYRTTWGVYPAGGEFDASQGSSVNNTRGGKGAGINPIWMSFFTSFLKAEAALKLNLPSAGVPRDMLEEGLRGSISKVLSFPATVGVTVPTNNIPAQANIDSYVDDVLANYDLAADDNERLAIIEKEYYLAAWGNGIEPYNNYRRTGYPDDMQFTVKTPSPGLFIRSVFYPSVFVNRNLNAPAQKNPGFNADKVFWDNNPDNFIH
ncbi:MAG: SusD/RagB family nutrient-binding outer membrane lipoprotein [Bacteroidota bacterium]